MISSLTLPIENAKKASIMGLSPELRCYLAARHRERSGETRPRGSYDRDFIQRLPRVEVGDKVTLSSFRLSEVYKQLIEGLGQYERATLTRVLGLAGFVVIEMEESLASGGRFRPRSRVYEPTVGEIRRMTDEQLASIEGVRKRGAEILRGLFGRAEDQETS